MNKTVLSKIYIICMALPAFAVFPVNYASRLCGYTFASAKETAVDHFLVPRSIMYVAVAFVFAIIAARRWAAGDVAGKRRSLIMLLTAAALTAVSCVFSVDPVLSLAGCDEQFEGVFVILVYILTVFISAVLIRTGEARTFLLRVLCVLCIVMGVISLVQVLTSGDKAYGTLYNSNFNGMFMAMMAPVMIMRLTDRDEKFRFRLYLPGSIGALTALFCSGARSAIAAGLSGVAAAIAGRILLKEKNETDRNCFYAAFMAVVFIIVCIYILTGFTGSRTKDTLSSHVENVETLQEGVVFTLDTGKLRLCFERPDDDHYYFELFDGEGRQIDYTENSEGTMYQPVDDRFEGLRFSIADYSGFYGFIVNVDGRDWFFYRAEDGDYYYLNGYTRAEKFIKAAHTGFVGRESFASNRGYIWSVSLPLLLKRPVTGCGPDTFAAVFPQNDVDKYLKTDIPYKMFITRPHSLYLQFGIQLGLIFAAGAAAFFLYTIIHTVRRGGEYSGEFILGLAAFLICGLFYDSCVCVTPFACILAGGAASSRDPAP